MRAPPRPRRQPLRQKRCREELTPLFRSQLESRGTRDPAAMSLVEGREHPCPCIRSARPDHEVLMAANINNLFIDIPLMEVRGLPRCDAQGGERPPEAPGRGSGTGPPGLPRGPGGFARREKRRSEVRMRMAEFHMPKARVARFIGLTCRALLPARTRRGSGDRSGRCRSPTRTTDIAGSTRCCTTGDGP